MGFLLHFGVCSWRFRGERGSPFRCLLSDHPPVSDLILLFPGKFNTLHWHIVDAQTFPYQSPAYPKIAQNAVWCPKCTYSQAEIKQVLQQLYTKGLLLESLLHDN